MLFLYFFLLICAFSSIISLIGRFFFHDCDRVCVSIEGRMNDISWISLVQFSFYVLSSHLYRFLTPHKAFLLSFVGTVVFGVGGDRRKLDGIFGFFFFSTICKRCLPLFFSLSLNTCSSLHSRKSKITHSGAVQMTENERLHLILTW